MFFIYNSLTNQNKDLISYNNQFYSQCTNKVRKYGKMQYYCNNSFISTALTN